MVWSIVFVCLILPVNASADFIVPFDTAFSNYDPGDPEYTGDYGAVEVTQNGDDVKFVVTAGPDLGGVADLQWLYLNTASEIAGLSLFSQDPATPAGTLNYDFNTSNTYYKADGDGFFDAVVDFGSGSPTLHGVEFLLSATNYLSADQFLAQSVGGDKGAFTIAAHWQNTMTDEGSEFVGGNPIPIPAAAWLLGSGLLGLIGFRRYNNKS
jgi:hypothetical protein